MESKKLSEIHGNDEWRRETKRILKNLSNDEFAIDRRFPVPLAVKETIWNKAKIHHHFDETIFKRDILGNVIIKGIGYRKDRENKIFAGEFEHFISHSNGGKNDLNNICLLNAGINRSKGSKEVFRLNFYEKTGMQKVYAISFNKLLKLLQYDIHDTCKRFNMTFILVDGKWSVKRQCDDYCSYHNEYKVFPMDLSVRIHDEKDLLVKSVASILACKAILVIIKWFRKNYHHYCNSGINEIILTIYNNEGS